MKKILIVLPLLFVSAFAFAQQKKVALGEKGALVTIGIDYQFKPVTYASSVTIEHSAAEPNKRIILSGNITITFQKVDSTSYGELWLYRTDGNETITLLPTGKQKGTFPTGLNEEIHIRYFRVAGQMKYEIL